MGRRQKLHTFIWPILGLTFLVACGGQKNDSGDELLEVSRVTVGAYALEGDDYVDQNADLTYAVGESCQSWSRTSREHGNPPPPGHEGTHEHFNAADASTYVGGVFTWIEYGPYLTADEVFDACSSGTSPSEPKSVTADEYTEFQPGLFLRIKSVE